MKTCFQQRFVLPVLTSAALALLLAAPSASQTQVTDNTLRLEEGADAPVGRLADVAWLAGSWAGTGLGGEVEETWTKPSGGTMIGTFKLLQNGEPSFYEFFEISEDAQTLVLRLKHFNPDMVGWEEKDGYVTFPLVKIDGNTAYFRGLTYRYVDEPGVDRLEIFLALHRGEQTDEVEFELKRQ